LSPEYLGGNVSYHQEKKNETQLYINARGVYAG
jgi:hypothetical protein